MSVTIQPLFPPEPEPDDRPVTPAERDLAGPVLKEVMEKSPGFTAQLRQAMTKEQMAQRAEAESQAATKAARDAAADTATVLHGTDPDSSRRFPWLLGSVLAGALALVDSVPSYFAAQAFGLDQAGTDVVTILLVGALASAMWLMTLFTEHRRHRVRAMVQIIVGVGLVIITVLRAQFLSATTGAGPATVLLQAIALSAMSGGLVAVGYVILQHRKSRVVAKTEQVASRRETEASVATDTAARLRASADDALLGLDNYVVPHALGMDPPQGLDHHRFVAALRSVVRALVVGAPGSPGARQQP
ncbi:MAG: hypothetical protein IVW52_07285 [Acidimicrobiales bacterium]|nr:hypothetical protein [Acidimicrobiales bacterium]